MPNEALKFITLNWVEFNLIELKLIKSILTKCGHQKEKSMLSGIHLRPLLFCLLDPLSSVQLLSYVWLFTNPWTAARQASLSITNSWSLLKLMSIKLVMLSNHLILCCPLRLPPSIFPNIRLFSNESVHIKWPKYWSFSFSISPSNEYSGLTSFRMDCLNLPAVQGTLKSLLQHHSSKASTLLRSAFYKLTISWTISPTLTSIHDYWKNHSFD